MVILHPRKLHPGDIAGIEYREHMYALKRKKKWTCTKCEWRSKAKLRNEIIVHHMNKNSTDHRSENLIVLCQDCHNIVHDIPLSPKRRRMIRERKAETEIRKNRPRRQYDDKGWPC